VSTLNGDTSEKLSTALEAGETYSVEHRGSMATLKKLL
jgi:hypothetical protein